MGVREPFVVVFQSVQIKQREIGEIGFSNFDTAHNLRWTSAIVNSLIYANGLISLTKLHISLPTILDHLLFCKYQ
jgi:hypothetical protein